MFTEYFELFVEEKNVGDLSHIEDKVIYQT